MLGLGDASFNTQVLYKVFFHIQRWHKFWKKRVFYKGFLRFGVCQNLTKKLTMYWLIFTFLFSVVFNFRNIVCWRQCTSICPIQMYSGIKFFIFFIKKPLIFVWIIEPFMNLSSSHKERPLIFVWIIKTIRNQSLPLH